MTTAEALTACPYCLAAAAARCVNPLTGLPIGWAHLERTRAAA